MVQFSRRQFMKVTGSTLAGSSLAVMGFSPATALAEVRQYKLVGSTVTRQTCTYIVKSPNRLLYHEDRAPGSNEWKRLSWDEALTRITKLIKEDRDANFLEKTDDGMTVNRWTTTGMLAASAASNEAGYITYKVARSWGMLAFDNQARV